MTMKNYVFGEAKINYDGPLDLNNFYALIQNYFYNKNYDFYENLNEETSHPTGKSILIDMVFLKKYTTYYRGEIIVKLRMNQVIPIILEGRHLFQGDINIKVRGNLDSDYEGKWNKGPLRWLLHIFANKTFYKRYYNQYAGWIKRDANELMEQVRSFLNTYNLREKSKL